MFHRGMHGVASIFEDGNGKRHHECFWSDFSFSSDTTGSVTTTNKENQIETSGDQIETQRSGSGSGS